MSLGYALLLPVLYHIWKLNAKSALYAVTLAVIIIILGNRGPLVAIICYLFFKYFFFGNSWQRIGLILFSLLLLATFLHFITLNFQYRNLLLLSEGQFISHDSNRSEIYRMIWNKILASPFWGYGIFGDRPVWSHNIFLEICCDFGLFIGPLLCIGMFAYAYKKIHNISKENKIYLFIFICATLFPLLVSSTYLNNMNFPLLLGLIYRINKKQIFS
jgi:O-antigen ligase